ncbi:chloramphenicol efflux pump [Microbacterium sorbitolivorans]|uniref:MFS transporter n=1 Tax=Microbacterium sorbitolivorans TaxID=1867410 RepID=A0A367Y2G7_9MICO|nr:MFS transporter [Microbacterium sorbitolivorans]RCK59819.1 MFS transporter [Microbacterium sorbitolivorans]GGF40273.1 chloramphenicol efflux pump [Microbacterium sorbitolivorans]
MRTFAALLVNTAVANISTMFMWFGLTFWIYLETHNVLSTALIGAALMIFVALSSMFFGTLVDRFRKKPVMAWGTGIALAVFVADALFFFAMGAEAIADLSRPWFWIFAIVMLAGAVVEQLRGIAMSTAVTLLVPEERRAKANGAVGAVDGVSMLVTSALSGLAIGYLGMGWTLVIGVAAVALAFAHLLTLPIGEPEVIGSGEAATGWVDIRGGWRAVRAADGLLFLVIFTALNNFVGGVFMALMDPYGLELMPVQQWGFAFAFASTGFIVGGVIVSMIGLGKNPTRTMLLLAAVTGAIGMAFTIREWAWLFVVGTWVYMALIPAVEAAEQTVIQKVVPYHQQGRVFGFARTFEASAAPVTSFAIGPVAEFIVIPHLRAPEGEAEWAWLLGTGDVRGIALIFVCAGAVTVILALGALTLPQYRAISRQYAQATSSRDA